MNFRLTVPVSMVLALAWGVRAETVLSDHPWTGTAVEIDFGDGSFVAGDREALLRPEGAGSEYRWYSAVGVTNIESVIVTDGRTYLDVDAPRHVEDALVRTIDYASSLTNTYATLLTPTNGAYGQIVTSARVKFRAFRGGPKLGAEDKISIWTGSNTTLGDYEGLNVSAGFVNGSFSDIDTRVFPLDLPGFDRDAWHDVVIRSIPDVTDGSRLSGFTITIDGVDAKVKEGTAYYAGLSSYWVSRFTADARMLMNSRRLFLARVKAGSDAALIQRGLAFTGHGAVAEIRFDSAMSSPERVFTLKWDGGVKSLTVDGVSLDLAKYPARYYDIPLAASAGSVSVVATYDTANSFVPGTWHGDNGASVGVNSFTFSTAVRNPVGIVASSSESVTIGDSDSSATTLAEAFANAKAASIGKITLARDVVGSIYNEFDQSFDFVIDLNGFAISNDSPADATITLYTGRLRIIDSSADNSGRVLPYRDYLASTNGAEATERTAVNCIGTTKFSRPVITICGGRYMGDVHVGGAKVSGSLVISNGVFISDSAYAFPLERYIADPSEFYEYDAPFWKKSAEKGFIWCQRGSNKKWSTPQNWKRNAVPTLGDVAIFPPNADGSWECDMDTGMAVKDFKFNGSVVLHGENEFADATWSVSPVARISGDATMRFSGAIPPDMSAVLADDWAGVVEVTDVAGPAALKDMVTWGRPGSVVRFAGVNGHVPGIDDLVFPYTLVLENGPAGYAWRNSAGFTGNILTFPRLTGDGAFVSPSNPILINQLLRFVDAEEFTGSLTVHGKRVVLGDGDPAAACGSIMWSHGFVNRTATAPGATNECTVAAFGGTLKSYRGVGHLVTRYTGSAVNAENAVVKLVSLGEDARLKAEDGEVKIVAMEAPSLMTMFASSFPTLAKASLYSVKSVSTDGDDREFVTLALNESALPVIGDGGSSAAMRLEDGHVWVTVSGTTSGLWYGLQRKSSLDGDWQSPEAWQTAAYDGERLLLYAPADDASGFYRVTVTDVRPGTEVK